MNRYRRHLGGPFAARLREARPAGVWLALALIAAALAACGQGPGGTGAPGY